jgi:hypothetical protein
LQQRILFDILGGFNNNASGVKRGDIVELDDDVADRYRHLGYCQDLDAAEQDDRQRQERADEAKAAWESHAKRLLDLVEHQRHAARHHTLDAGTGLPIDHTNKKGSRK